MTQHLVRALLFASVWTVACGGEDEPAAQSDAEVERDAEARDAGTEDEPDGADDAGEVPADEPDAGAARDAAAEVTVGGYLYTKRVTPSEIHGHACAINDSSSIVICGDAAEDLWRLEPDDDAVVPVDPPAGFHFDSPQTTQVCLSPAGTIFVTVRDVTETPFIGALGVGAPRVSPAAVELGMRILGCTDDRVLYGSGTGVVWTLADDALESTVDAPVALAPDGAILLRTGLYADGTLSTSADVCSGCAAATVVTSGGVVAGELYDTDGQVTHVYRYGRDGSAVDTLAKPDGVTLLRGLDTHHTLILSTLSPVMLTVVRDDVLTDVTPTDREFFGVTFNAASPGGLIVGEGILPGAYRIFTLDPRY